MIITLLFTIIYKFIRKSNDPPIFGVYKQRNKYHWLKFVFIYVYLFVKQAITRLRRAYAVDIGTSCDGTIQIHEEDAVLEKKYDLGDFPNAVDAVYFNGISNDGAAVICGLARRANHMTDSFIYIKLNDKDVLLSSKLPDTVFKQTDEEIGEYKVQGIEIANIIPMRTWTLTYKGEMKLRKTQNMMKVEADLTWSASWAPFNFDHNMSPSGLANDMARETWTKSYFEILKQCHQTHYEQMGILKGSITVDGIQHPINMPCVRDHTFGNNRQWRNFHRYILHFIFLDNGDSMMIGVVSQPIVLSHLTIGYVCKQSDQIPVAVDSCDFQLYQHGENQVLPFDYGFSFMAGGENYTVKVKVEDEESFYIGDKREAKFFERWANVEVNGVKGKACCEWQYNNVLNSYMY